MLVEFRSHPDGVTVAIDTNQIRSILRARGGLAYTLIRCLGGMEVVVHGKKEQVVAKLDQTSEGPALRLG